LTWNQNAEGRERERGRSGDERGRSGRGENCGNICDASRKFRRANPVREEKGGRREGRRRARKKREEEKKKQGGAGGMERGGGGGVAREQ